MGILYLVYPFKVHVLRLISMEANYPSAAKMRLNRRRNERFQSENNESLLALSSEKNEHEVNKKEKKHHR